MSSFRKIPARRPGHSVYVGFDRIQGGYFWALFDIPNAIATEAPAIKAVGEILTVDDLIDASDEEADWTGQVGLVGLLLDDPNTEDREASAEAQALVAMARLAPQLVASPN